MATSLFQILVNKFTGVDMNSNYEKVKVDWQAKARGISQVYSSGLEYCFVSNKFEQCHPFVFCKDFLQDCIYAHVNSKTASIFGFSYNPKTMAKIDMENTRIAVANSKDSSIGKKIDNVLDFINQFCKKLKLKRSKVFTCSNPPLKYRGGVYVLCGSGMWMNSPPLISLYSLLIRLGFVHTKGEDCIETINKILKGTIKPYQSSDTLQLMQAKNGIDKILKLGYRKFFYKDIKKNYPERVPVGTMHGSCGIVGFSQNCTKNVVPYWNRGL